MIEELSIRKFRDGDEVKINDLLAAVFPGWKGIDYWRRKYLDNPAGFRRNIWVAEDGNKIVGYYAVIPTLIHTGEGVVAGAQSVDTATHPAYRKRKLFETLMRKTLDEAERDGIRLVYGFPGQMSYGGFIKNGWAETKIPRHYRILNLRKALRLGQPWLNCFSHVTRALFQSVLALVCLVSRKNLSAGMKSSLRAVLQIVLVFAVVLSNLRVLLPVRKSTGTGRHHINTVKRFDNAITDLWREVAGHYPNTVDRNTHYLNWRYSKNPEDDYTYIVAESQDRIDGYTVLKNEANSGVIMDIIARNEAAFAALLGAALAHFGSEGRPFIEIWMTGNPSFDRILRSFGFGSYFWLDRLFVRSRKLKGFMSPFILYTKQAGLLGVKTGTIDPAAWFISPGDTDWENISSTGLIGST